MYPIKSKYSNGCKMVKKIVVAATQMKCTNVEENLKKAESLIRIAASRGAQVVLLQELFQESYFPNELNEKNFTLAETVDSSPLLKLMTKLACELQVVLPISFFEKSHHDYYNSIAMIDADGSILGIYRNVHTASRVGISNHYYFTPCARPNTVYATKYGNFGVGVSCDQWFPEMVRMLALQGAEIVFFPSAIGTEPNDAKNDCKEHWHRVVQGHAACNMIPIVVSNRVGTEQGNVFYGSSFIAGPTGAMLKIADRESEGVLVEEFKLHQLQGQRASFGLLRDRRPNTYDAISHVPKSNDQEYFRAQSQTL